MEVFNTLFGVPLGYLLDWCYALAPYYGPAIILFTLATKVILFPLSMLAQKNAVTMARIKPLAEDIRRRHDGDSAKVMAEQRALNKREHYSALKGMLPLLIQIPLILGLINVIYKPLQHLLRLPAATINGLIMRTAELLDTTPQELGYGAQLRVMEQVQASPEAFAGSPGLSSEAAVAQIQTVDLSLWGMNLAEVPAWDSLTIIWPILSAISALALCVYQNRYYVLNRFQSHLANNSMTVFMVAFSGYFALVLPCGLGLYWTAGNLLSIATVWLCNVFYRPEKFINFSAMPKPVRLTAEQRRQRRQTKRTNQRRQRRDSRRFFATPDKALMIYAESSGYWKYYRRLVEYLLAHTSLTIHYVTSDPQDKIFSREHERLKTYYIGQRGLISFMMKLDVDVVAMTTPDLETFHIKRSLVRKDAEYIYLDHGMTSFHLMLRENALDHFDTIFCYGPNHIDEIRLAEAVYELPPKRLVKTGYGLLDDLLESVAGLDTSQVNDPPIALVAPSWQVDNLIELCLPETVTPLLEAGFHVIVRPHPEFVKRFGAKIASLAKLLAPEIEAGRLELQTDFSSNSTVYSADLVITDWSSIAQEFSYATKKPSIFINTPMKVMNPNWEWLCSPPLDITLRDMIGVSIDVDALAGIGDVALDLMRQTSVWRERIEQVLQDNIYNIGHSEVTMAAYLLEATTRQRDARQDDPGPGRSRQNRPVELLGAGAFVAAVAVLAAPEPAQAYIDPATTSYLIQIVAGLVITLSVAVGVFFRRILLALMTIRARLMAWFVVATSPRHWAFRRPRTRRTRRTETVGPESGARVSAGADLGAAAGVSAGAGTAATATTDAASAAVAGLGVGAGMSPASGSPANLAASAVTSQSVTTLATSDGPSPDKLEAALAAARERRGQTTEQSAPVNLEHPDLAVSKTAFLWSDKRGRPLRFAIAGTAGFAPGFLFFFFGFLDLFLQNIAEFPFGARQLLIIALAVWGVTGAILTLVLYLLRGRVFDVAVSLVLGLTLAAWVQGSFLDGYLGTLNGQAIQWGRFARLAVTNSAIWLAVGLLPLLIRIISRKIWTAMAWVLPTALIASGSIGLVAALPPGGLPPQDTVQLYPTYDGLYEPSAGPNQFMFILDMMDQKFVNQITTEEPDFFASQLDGFTEFDNYISNHSRTLPSAVDMVTGELFMFDHPLSEYYTQAYRDGTFLPELREAGYSTNIYATTRYSYGSIDDIAGLADNVLRTKMVTTDRNVLKGMTLLSAFRYAPHIAKPTFWRANSLFREGAIALQGGGEPFVTRNVAFYNKLKTQGLHIRGDKPRFSYVHLDGAHNPATIDRNVKPIEPDSQPLVEQARGAFRMVFEYIAELKRLGLYRDATIVISADHGQWTSNADRDGLNVPRLTALFVKPAGAEGTPMRHSLAPIDVANVRATFLADAHAKDPAHVRTVFQVPDDDQTPRQYYFRRGQPAEGENIEHYEVIGDARDFENWHLIAVTPVLFAG
ncbi:MAG: membrane protein insertase YidC [Bifidobacteriaceae bacterium]|jgi:YidC/Oxa1 family membrane protein insertase|nr:membrane protein insertase YidC [Bifidobacteriaceae bacterium]